MISDPRYYEEVAKHEKEVCDDVRNNPIELAEKLNRALKSVSKKLKSDVHVAYSLVKHKKSLKDCEGVLPREVELSDKYDCKYTLTAKISVKHSDYVKVTSELLKEWDVFVDLPFYKINMESEEVENGHHLGINLSYTQWAFYKHLPGYFDGDSFERLCKRLYTYNF